MLYYFWTGTILFLGFGFNSLLDGTFLIVKFLLFGFTEGSLYLGYKTVVYILYLGIVLCGKYYNLSKVDGFSNFQLKIWLIYDCLSTLLTS